MKKSLLALTLASLFAMPAMAQTAAPAAEPAAAEPASPLSFNVGLVSDYLFRGVSQTHGKPALQAGIDYADPSGFYIGAWASNISWVKNFTGSGSLEVDVYGGYKNTFGGGDWNYDFGFITYNYPNNRGSNLTVLANPNTQEVYASIGYKWLTAKYSQATSKNFIGWYGGSDYNRNTRGSGYFEVNANYDLGDGWNLLGHVGHQTVKNSVNTDAIRTPNYTDWKLGVTKDVGFGVLGLAYSDTNARGTCSSGGGTSSYCWGRDGNSSNNTAPNRSFRDVAKGTVVASFLKTF